MLVQNYVNVSVFSFIYTIPYNKRLKNQMYKADEWRIIEIFLFLLLFMGTINKMHIIFGDLERYRCVLGFLGYG